MNYYSEISKSRITEQEAIKQIVDLCNRWYQMAQPSEELDTYIKSHPDLLDIERWNCFRKTC